MASLCACSSVCLYCFAGRLLRAHRTIRSAHLTNQRTNQLHTHRTVTFQSVLDFAHSHVPPRALLLRLLLLCGCRVLARVAGAAALRSSLGVSSSELSAAASLWLSAVSSLLSGGSSSTSSSSVPSLPSLLRRLRTGRQLSRVRERLLLVLALHQPLDGLSQHSNTTMMTAVAAVTDERKEKSRWDGDSEQKTATSDEDSEEAADTESGGTAVHEQSAAADSDDRAARLPSETAQHSQHRDRDLLASCWSTVRGGSFAVAVLSVWDECFAASFNGRCQELVQASFARFKFHDTIERALLQWKDENGDSAAVAAEPNTATAGWSAAAVSSMWSGYRQSAVTVLVSSFALQLERLAADVRHLLTCSLADIVRQATAQQAGGSTLSGSVSSAVQPGPPALLYPFDYLSFLSLPRFLDDELSPSLHRLYTASVHSMAEQLKRRLAALDHSVLTLMASEASWRSDECRSLVERAVFIGRCCASITQQTAFASFSQALHQQQQRQHHATAHTAAPASASALSAQAVSSFSSSSPSASPIVAALSSTARSAFRIWSRFVAATVSDEMETAFSAWRRKAALATHNEQQQPQRTEETALNSLLPAAAAPTQPSAYIHRVLWTVQQHTYSTHGYQAPHEVLRWMMQDTAIALTAVLHAQVDGRSDTDGSHHSSSVAQEQDASAAAEHEQRRRRQPQFALAAPLAAAPLTVLLQLYFDLLFLLSMMRLPSEAAGQPAKLSQRDDSLYPSSGLAVLQYVENAVAARMSAAAWPALRSAVVASCLLCLHRTQLLFGLLSKRNPLPPLQLLNPLDGSHTAMLATAATAAATATGHTGTGAASAAAASTAASGLPLAPTSSRIMTFSTSFYTHTASSANRQQQHRSQQLQQQQQSQQPHLVSGSSTGSRLLRAAVSVVPVAVAASGPSSSSSVAANAASVASESAALLKEKGRQLLGKWNLV